MVRLSIENVDGSKLEGGAPRAAHATRANGIRLDECSQLRGGIVGGPDSQELAVEAIDERALGLAQPDRVLRQRLEDRLEIERGPADDLEELAGRRLLLERVPQLAVACLQLGEQPHVLDGDHGLVGECLEEHDLLVGEGPRLSLVDIDGADREAIA